MGATNPEAVVKPVVEDGSGRRINQTGFKLQPLLCVCVCTCKRPKSLRGALQSLGALQLPPDVRVAVTVVDNDPEGQAGRAVVESLAGEFPLPLECILEPRRGIPYARNRCIHAASAKNADYLIFIDDDEWVAPDWLTRLYGYARFLGGSAVVSGSVISQLPAAAPEYYSMFFSRRRRKTGERLTYCATNNVLVPMGIVEELGLRFDERDPFAGGEDVMFFTEASTKGVEIVHCAEATVYEAVPVGRANLRWLSRRKFSVGVTLAKQKLVCGRSRAGVLASALFQLLTACASLPFAMVTGRRLGSRAWLRLCRSTGMACGVFGVRPQFYRVVEGG
ncbi:glycosyltransferase family 2 protein [Microbulbifer discodermiae]|uniref:glycosyltransferase family 2 protein n=1 Tax=Microbulbifer sp. 2201CG32-9 TaxID=3232309 RepID=UPI00345C4C43